MPDMKTLTINGVKYNIKDDTARTALDAKAGLSSTNSFTGTNMFSQGVFMPVGISAYWYQTAPSNRRAYINDTQYTGNAATATKATKDGAGNVIVDTYAKKTDIPSPVTVDAELSSTSENPVQNKAIATALDNKHDKNADVLVGTTNGRRLGFDNKNCLQCNLTGIDQSPVQIRLISNGQDRGSLLVEKSLTNDAYAFTGTNGKHDGKAGLVPVPTIDDDGYFLKSDGTWAALDEYGKLSQANTWTSQQTFNEAILNKARITQEVYQSEYKSGTAVTPSKSTMCFTATGAVTLNMATIVANCLAANQTSTIFTAYITSTADYTLTITNAGTIKYIGSASDVAITSAGLLLNIMLMKDGSGNVTSIVQAGKLEGGA